jgi:hypothetical protein
MTPAEENPCDVKSHWPSGLAEWRTVWMVVDLE